MPEEFRSLAQMLAPPCEAPPLEIAVEDESAEAEAALLREVRLFRANVAERVDAAVETLLRDIACDVLARELRIGPAEIDAIVLRALERYFSEEPLRVHVHPADAPRVTCDIPVIADETLREGDAVIELRDGAIDASLGVRLDAVLREAVR